LNKTLDAYGGRFVVEAGDGDTDPYTAHLAFSQKVAAMVALMTDFRVAYPDAPPWTELGRRADERVEAEEAPPSVATLVKEALGD
jgi:hypothetical protein